MMTDASITDGDITVVAQGRARGALDRRSRSWLLAAMAFAVLLALWIQLPRITDPYSVEEDARSFFWWQRLQDPDVFRNFTLRQSQVTELELGPITLIVYEQSPGYSLLFQLASFLAPPVLFSKFLIFPLLLVSVCYLFQIGRMISGRRTSFALCIAFVIFNLASSTEISAVGGLQRSFGLPFLLALTYYLIRRRYRAALVVIFLSGVIYAPAMMLGAVTYGLSLIRRGAKSWREAVAWKQLPPLIGAVLLAGSLLLPTITSVLNSRAQPNPTSEAESVRADTLLNDPRWQEGGRRVIFENFPLIGRGGIATNGGTVMHIFLLSVLALMTWRLRPQSLVSFPLELKWLFIAGILCYAAAWLAAWVAGSFPLYLPSRYTRMSMPLFLLIYIMVNLRSTTQYVAGWLRGQRGQVFLLTVPLGLLALILSFFNVDVAANSDANIFFRNLDKILIALAASALILSAATLRRNPRVVKEKTTAEDRLHLTSTRRWLLSGALLLVPALIYVQLVHAEFYVATPAERALYKFLGTLPEDVMIGGSPCSIDAIPIFAARAIFFSCEDPLGNQRLMLQAFEAYYAESWGEVADFCHENGIDVIVVNEDDFDDERLASGQYFFEPFDSYLKPRLTTQTLFALKEFPERSRLFSAGNLHALSCS